MRRAVPLGLVLALFLPFDAYPAQGSANLPARSGGQGAGMYSNNVNDGGTTSRKYLGNAAAEVLTEAELLPALVSALDQLSKYRRPVALPEIIRVPHARIEELVCKAKCAALAVYRPGEGIYLDDSLKPETDLFARSVLLHELVHYVQDMSGAHADMKPCMRWYHREQEAYAVQKIFLGMSGSPTRVGYSAHQSPCEDESASVNKATTH
jgi:hypothetical protein